MISLVDFLDYIKLVKKLSSTTFKPFIKISNISDEMFIIKPAGWKLYCMDNEYKFHVWRWE